MFFPCAMLLPMAAASEVGPYMARASGSVSSSSFSSSSSSCHASPAACCSRASRSLWKGAHEK